MIRHLFIFLATFVVGATIALVGRASIFKPHAGPSGPAHAAAEHAPMVSNALAPAKPDATARPEPPNTPVAEKGHEGHGTAPPAMAAIAQSPSAGPVNTVCAICGMDVDSKIPLIEYQGKKIGFGCKMCPPKFKADPDKYGPIYLRNEVIKR